MNFTLTKFRDTRTLSFIKFSPFLYLISLSLLASSAHALTTDPIEVDLSTALEFERHNVSQYIVDKNYNSFLATRNENPSTVEKSQWFIKFISEQALVAELKRDGWSSRPEIALTVDAMERYMLAQDNGPFFQVVVPIKPKDEFNIDVIRKQAETKVTGTFIKLNRTREHSINRKEVQLALSNREQLQTVIEHSEIAMPDMSLTWPFHPFMEIRDEIGNAEIGKTYGPYNMQGQVIYFQLDAREQSAKPNEGKPDAFFLDYAQFIDRTVRLDQYKYQWFLDLDIRPDRANIKLIADNLSVVDQGKIRLTETELANTKLASCLLDGERINVNASQIIESNNYSIERFHPSNSEELEKMIENYVFSKQCQTLARKLEISSTPRFDQNRLNFESGNILDSYKSQRLTTSEPYSRQELTSAFDRRFRNVRETVLIQGNMLIYDSWEDATNGETPSRILNDIKVGEEMTQINEIWPTSFLFSLADGQSIGPAPYKSSFAIFEKTKTLESRPLQLEERKEQLERSLFEKDFAIELEGSFAQRAEVLNFQCFIDFTRYKMENPLMTISSNSKP